MVISVSTMSIFHVIFHAFCMMSSFVLCVGKDTAMDAVHVCFLCVLVVQPPVA